MLLLSGFAFLSGLVTIFAPCIWPLLPIILSSSVSSQGRRRPLGISLGVMISFLFFTLFTSLVVRVFNLDPDIFRKMAVVVIMAMAVVLIMPPLSAWMDLLLSRLTARFGSNNLKSGTGFSGGLITGLSLGVVWSPCAGPILATIAAIAATGKISLDIFIITFAYVLGVGIPLFTFSLASQKFFIGSRGLSPLTGRIRQLFGVVMIIVALAIYSNFDMYVQYRIVNLFPNLGAVLNGFENSPAITNKLRELRGISGGERLLISGFPAPDITGGLNWLNTEKPLTLSELKGKVVLIDFWTYTCINCIRTFPHLNDWYHKYRDQGFEIIGVHTPEFEFEKKTDNVALAISRFNLEYPVVQDNSYAIWNRYGNLYWPAGYLIDTKGLVRKTHFGEGGYEEMEKAIRSLLEESGSQLSSSSGSVSDETPKIRTTPEIYLGSSRMENHFPGSKLDNGVQNLSYSGSLPENRFSFSGNWTVAKEFSQAGDNAILYLNYFADKVFLVMRPGNTGTGRIRIVSDGDQSQASEVSVVSDQLYTVQDNSGKPGGHLLRIEFLTPGIEVFAFTFG